MFDFAIIGGGIIGSSTALFLARGGMHVALLERHGLCLAASGRNAGTLTLLYARGPLLPLVVGGKAMWEDAPSWLGASADYHRAAGIEVAFTEQEAALLERDMTLRRDAGLPIEIVGGKRAREIEPGLSDKVILAAHCAEDGYAASNLIGGRIRTALIDAGATVRDGAAVTGITVEDGCFVLDQGGTRIKARRILLAANIWVKEMLGWLGVHDLPIRARVAQMIVTERRTRAINAVVRVVSQISLKQTNNGMCLIGSGAGFDWYDDPNEPGGDLKPDNVAQKIGIAVHAVPALANTRIVRTWHGIEGYAHDNFPLIGPVPGVAGAYVMACLRSGWSIGPYGGKLMAEILLGKRAEHDLFHPAFGVKRMLAVKVAA